MSVIIRLQNLPWSANALDIRQFFKGLSIPEGGVHIVGGEMGDAFIAFSTDEDARQAMMHDREKINEVQVRLLLSSRAEMQKVIETARQQSMLALQNAGAIPKPKTVITPAVTLPTPQPPVITTNSLQNILAAPLGAAPSFLTYQQQAGITLNEKPITDLATVTTTASSSSSSTRRASNDTQRERRRSSSRERRRSRSRDRNDRASSSRRFRRDKSRSRSRERDYKGRRSSRRSKSRERSHERSHERSRDRSRERVVRENRRETRKDKDYNFGNRSSKETFVKSSSIIEIEKAVKPPVISSWSVPPTNAYQTNIPQKQLTNAITATTPAVTSINPFNIAPPISIVPNAYSTSVSKALTDTSILSSASTIIPGFQNYSSTLSTTTNNYSINLLGSSNSNSNDSIKPFALQNPYTAALQAVATLNTNSQDSTSSAAPTLNPSLITTTTQGNTMFSGLFLDKKNETTPQHPTQPQQQQQQLQAQEPITFANTNPYAQMYPNLFAQAAATGTISNFNQQQQQTQQHTVQDSQTSPTIDLRLGDSGESCSIKVSNLCANTTYSDLRKFFAGLYIPHNGIKMVNDKQGLRTGIAFIQFSRISSVQKALTRNNTVLRNKVVKLEMVPDAEFDNNEDSFRPQNRNYGERNERGNGSAPNANYGNNNWNDNNSEGRWGAAGSEGSSNNNRNSGFRGNNNNNAQAEHINPFASPRLQEPFSVLYIENIPPLTTERDIMKMFTSYTIYDILLLPNAENRREFVAYVRFSREEEAKTALEEQSKHLIGYRKVYVRPGNIDAMDKAKEKLRLANEQLMKEEQAMAAEEAEEEEKRKKEAEEKENEKEGIMTAESIQIDDEDDESATAQGDDVEGAQDDGQNNMNSQQQQSNKNITNLFDVIQRKPFDNAGGQPNDPRLRRQQRPSRFDNANTDNPGNNMNISLPPAALQAMANFQHNFNTMNNDNNNNNNNNANNNNNNNMEMRFIIMKNCSYNTHINDVAQLYLGANLGLKHVEPLRNERNMPSGEFIVEFQNDRDAETAINQFNNTQFNMRNLRIRSINPQEIADRLGKPFLNYYPGGGGNGGRKNFNNPGMFNGPNLNMAGDFNNMQNFRGNGNMSGASGMRLGPGGGGNNMRPGRNNFGIGGGFTGGNNSVRRGRGNGKRRGNNFNNDEDNDNDSQCDRDEPHEISDEDDNIDDDSDNHRISDNAKSNKSNSLNNSSSSNGIPEKFNRPGCVVTMENVPFKADQEDIIRFFSNFDITPDDIIRRFNDDGTPTGDARVAFDTPATARAALEARKRKQIFNRSIYLNIL